MLSDGSVVYCLEATFRFPPSRRDGRSSDPIRPDPENGRIMPNRDGGIPQTRIEKRAVKGALNNIKDASRRFAEFDVNGDGLLDFEEFYAMLPHRLREAYTSNQIHGWFDDADTDGDGTLSINEFFLWSLGTSAEKFGATSITNALKKFDRSPDKSGLFDMLSFERLCIELGFGAHQAQSIFRSLDIAGTGTVTIDEIVMLLGKDQSTIPAKHEAKQFITSLVWSWDESSTSNSDRRALERQAASWRITGNDATTIRKQLQEHLQKSGAMVADLVKLFDDDNTGEMLIDDMEFHKAMKTRFGFRGMPWVLDEVFKSIDLDGSGEIGFDELFEFVRGRRHSLDRRTREVRCLALQTAKGYDLTDLDWDADQLRLQIKTALERRKLSTTDLIRAWDRSGDQRISKIEFLNSIGELFSSSPAHQQLFRDTVHPIATKIFWAICGGDNEIDVAELERWLREQPALNPLKSGGITDANAKRRASETEAIGRLGRLLENDAEAQRRAAASRELVRKRVDEAITSAATTSRAREAVALANRQNACVAEAQRIAFMRTPLGPIPPAPSSRRYSRSGHAPRLDEHKSLPITTSRMTTNLTTSQSSSALPAVRQGRRVQGVAVLQRWERDTCLPSDLKPAPLRFSARVPRTRKEEWQQDRSSVAVLPPFGKLRPQSALKLTQAVQREELIQAVQRAVQRAALAPNMAPESWLAGSPKMWNDEADKNDGHVDGKLEENDGQVDGKLEEGPLKGPSATEAAMRRLELRLMSEASEEYGIDLLRNCSGATPASPSAQEAADADADADAAFMERYHMPFEADIKAEKRRNHIKHQQHLGSRWDGRKSTRQLPIRRGLQRSTSQPSSSTTGRGGVLIKPLPQLDMIFEDEKDVRRAYTPLERMRAHTPLWDVERSNLLRSRESVRVLPMREGDQPRDSKGRPQTPLWWLF